MLETFKRVWLKIYVMKSGFQRSNRAVTDVGFNYKFSKNNQLSKNSPFPSASSKWHDAIQLKLSLATVTDHSKHSQHFLLCYLPHFDQNIFGLLFNA